MLIYDRGALAVENNSNYDVSCVSVSNDSDIELLHSALDLNYTDSIRNDSTESSTIQIADGVSLDLELPFILQLKFSSIVVPVDGYLTCRSRKTGREQSVYIGGA